MNNRLMKKNKPDRAKMRPDCVLACIDFALAIDLSDTWKDRKKDGPTDKTTPKSTKDNIT